MTKSYFLNSLSRARASVEYDARYKRIPTSGVCFYCGDDAQTGDHVPPLSCVRKRDADSPHWLVPSCQRCNQLLGAHQSVDLKVRCRYLEEKARSKGNPIEVPSSPGRIMVWIMPPMHDYDRDLIGKATAAISGGALVFTEGRLGGDLRRSVLEFSYHRNLRVARGVISGMLGRALTNEWFLWGFGCIPSMEGPDPRNWRVESDNGQQIPPQNQQSH